METNFSFGGPTFRLTSAQVQDSPLLINIPEGELYFEIDHDGDVIMHENYLSQQQVSTNIGIGNNINAKFPLKYF